MMKKLMIYMLVAPLLSVMLASCKDADFVDVMIKDMSPETVLIVGENAEAIQEVDMAASELAAKILAVYAEEDVPSLYTFLSGASEESENYLEAERAGLFFTGEYGNIPEFFGAQTDYAYLIPTGYYVFEIDVIRSNDAAAAEALLKLRLAQKNNGDIEQYRPEELPQLEDAEIFSVGSYSFLLSTKDNAAARAVIDELLGK